MVVQGEREFHRHGNPLYGLYYQVALSKITPHIDVLVFYPFYRHMYLHYIHNDYDYCY